MVMRQPWGTQCNRLSGRRIVFVAVLVGLWGGCPLAVVRAQSRAVEVLVPKEECKVKYATLYGLGLLTPWPTAEGAAAENNPFVIGIVGGKPFPELIQELAEKRKIQERPIEIRWIEKSPQLDGCHLVYITENATSALEQAALERLKGQHVLVVGERPNPSDEYVVNFVVVDGRVRFPLNHASARSRKIVLDPRLVRSAIP